MFFFSLLTGLDLHCIIDYRNIESQAPEVIIFSCYKKCNTYFKGRGDILLLQEKLKMSAAYVLNAS